MKKKLLSAIFCLLAMNAGAQEIEVCDSVDVIPSVAQIPLNSCDSLIVCSPECRYGIVWKDGKCGIYDISKMENVTKIEYKELWFSLRKEMEGKYYTYFGWDEADRSGVIGVAETDNSYVAISMPKENDEEKEEWNSSCHTDNWTDSIQVNIRLARWCNAEAFVALADCYHNGNGVAKGFPMVIDMLFAADRYSDEGRLSDKYFASLPEQDEDRLTYETLMALDHHKIGIAKEKTAMLEAVSPVAGKTMRAVIAIEENGDTATFYRLINEAIAEKHLMASVMLIQRYEAEGKGYEAVEVAKKIAEQVPMAYNYLGKYYKEKGEREKCIECYRKADEWACLNSEGAAVLLEEISRLETINKQQDEKELRRLRLIRDGIGG